MSFNINKLVLALITLTLYANGEQPKGTWLDYLGKWARYVSHDHIPFKDAEKYLDHKEYDTVNIEKTGPSHYKWVSTNNYREFSTELNCTPLSCTIEVSSTSHPSDNNTFFVDGTASEIKSMYEKIDKHYKPKFDKENQLQN